MACVGLGIVSASRWWGQMPDFEMPWPCCVQNHAVLANDDLFIDNNSEASILLPVQYH